MPVYPGAVRRLIPRHNVRRTRVRNRVNLHVAASEAMSLYGYFSSSGKSSHFYVLRNGTVEQYVDTDFYSGADLEGNDATISIETQGGRYNADSEEWTPQQLRAIADLFVWITTVHPSIPRKLATDSKIGDSSKGLSWHRLGIDSYPTPFQPGWRVPGSMKYSKDRGKLCPGKAKIRQISVILDMVNGSDPTPDPTPAPEPTPKEYDMDVIDLRNADKTVVTGRHVDNLQGLLLAAGYGPEGLVGYNGRPDGLAGAATKRYAGDWQRRTNTGDGKGNPDFIFGDKSWKSLIEF